MTLRLNNALFALGLMYNQYCSEQGHLFMCAGEEASSVLEKEGLLFADEIGRGECDDEKLSNLLK